MINQERHVPLADPESAAQSIGMRQRATAVFAMTRSDWASRRAVDEPVVKRTSSRADRAYWRWIQRYLRATVCFRHKLTLPSLPNRSEEAGYMIITQSTSGCMSLVG